MSGLLSLNIIADGDITPLLIGWPGITIGTIFGGIVFIIYCISRWPPADERLFWLRGKLLCDPLFELDDSCKFCILLATACKLGNVGTITYFSGVIIDILTSKAEVVVCNLGGRYLLRMEFSPCVKLLSYF